PPKDSPAKLPITAAKDQISPYPPVRVQAQRSETREKGPRWTCAKSPDMPEDVEVNSNKQNDPSQPVRIELLKKFIMCVRRFELIRAKRRNHFPGRIESMPDPGSLDSLRQKICPNAEPPAQGFGLVSGIGVDVIIGIQQAPKQRHHRHAANKQQDFRFAAHCPVPQQQKAFAGKKCGNRRLAKRAENRDSQQKCRYAQLRFFLPN